jgi:hypothetical protein
MKLTMISSLYSKLFLNVADLVIEYSVGIEPIHDLNAIQDEVPINNLMRLHLIHVCDIS